MNLSTQPSSTNASHVDKLLNMAANSFNGTLSKMSTELKRQERMLEYDLALERIEPYVVDMSVELPDIEPIINIDGSCVCSRGNISAICGEAKSRKTFLTSALVASAMAIPLAKLNNFKNVAKEQSLNVLWIDTEQGERHVRRVIKRITHMTGAELGGAIAEPRLKTLALRELAPHDRKAMLYDAMRVGSYDLVVIDGIADLQRNTNDLEESDALVSELMALSTHTNTHILCVLHTNPGSDKARGHLGSSLQRKAETVIYVHRVDDVSVVEPQFCRNEPFERFAFNVGEDGIPKLCPLPASNDEQNPVISLLVDNYGGAIERIVLVNKLVEQHGYKTSTAQMKIKRLIERGMLVADGRIVKIAGHMSEEQKSQSHKITQSQGVGVSVIDVTNVTNAPVSTDDYWNEEYDTPF